MYSNQDVVFTIRNINEEIDAVCQARIEKLEEAWDYVNTEMNKLSHNYSEHMKRARAANKIAEVDYWRNRAGTAHITLTQLQGHRDKLKEFMERATDRGARLTHAAERQAERQEA